MGDSGADAASDYYLEIMKMKLKLHRNPDRANSKARFDTYAENEMFKSTFSVELCNSFQVRTRGLRKYQRRLYTDGQIVHRNCLKGARPSEKEKQAVVEREHLENNRPTAKNPRQNT